MGAGASTNHPDETKIATTIERMLEDHGRAGLGTSEDLRSVLLDQFRRNTDAGLSDKAALAEVTKQLQAMVARAQSGMQRIEEAIFAAKNGGLSGESGAGVGHARSKPSLVEGLRVRDMKRMSGGAAVHRHEAAARECNASPDTHLPLTRKSKASASAGSLVDTAPRTLQRKQRPTSAPEAKMGRGAIGSSGSGDLESTLRADWNKHLSHDNNRPHTGSDRSSYSAAGLGRPATPQSSTAGTKGVSTGQVLCTPPLGRRLPTKLSAAILSGPPPTCSGYGPSPGRSRGSRQKRFPRSNRVPLSPGRQLHPSPGRVHPSPGRRHPSPGRIHPSPGRIHPSPGRMHPTPGGTPGKAKVRRLSFRHPSPHGKPAPGAGPRRPGKMKAPRLSGQALLAEGLSIGTPEPDRWRDRTRDPASRDAVQSSGALPDVGPASPGREPDSTTAFVNKIMQGIMHDDDSHGDGSADEESIHKSPTRYKSQYGLPCAQLDYVINRYHLHEKLGEGAYGRVYKGFDSELSRTVAIKICTVTVSKNHDREEREKELENEIRILQMCQSPYVTQYLDAHLCSERRKNDRFWIIMEFCDSGSLLDFINTAWEKDGRMGSLKEETITRISTFILLGLEFLHSKKIIHRDLKGGNVLLTSSGCVKIADFGVSRQLNASSGSGSFADTMVGTPVFAAPEVLQSGTSRTAYDQKVDIWSFGIVLIELCQTQLPYKFRTPYMAMIRIPNLAAPKLLDPTSRTPAMNDFLAQALTKDPRFRPSASQLLDHPVLASAVAELEPNRAERLQRHRSRIQNRRSLRHHAANNRLSTLATFEAKRDVNGDGVGPLPSDGLLLSGGKLRADSNESDFSFGLSDGEELTGTAPQPARLEGVLEAEEESAGDSHDSSVSVITLSRAVGGTASTDARSNVGASTPGQSSQGPVTDDAESLPFTDDEYELDLHLGSKVAGSLADSDSDDIGEESIPAAGCPHLAEMFNFYSLGAPGSVDPDQESLPLSFEGDLYSTDNLGSDNQGSLLGTGSAFDFDSDMYQDDSDDVARVVDFSNITVGSPGPGNAQGEGSTASSSTSSTGDIDGDGTLGGTFIVKPFASSEVPVKEQTEYENDTIHIPDPRSSRNVTSSAARDGTHRPSNSALPALNNVSSRNETGSSAAKEVGSEGGIDPPTTWRKFSPGRPKRSLNKSNIRPSPSPSPALSKSRSRNARKYDSSESRPLKSTPRSESVRSKHSSTGTPTRRVRRRSRQNAPASANAAGRHRRVDSGGSIVVPGSPPPWDPGTQADDEEAGHFSGGWRQAGGSAMSTLPSTLRHKSPGTMRREAKMNGDGPRNALNGLGVAMDPAPIGCLKLKRLQQLAPTSLSAENFGENTRNRRTRKEVKYDSPLDRSKRTFGATSADKSSRSADVNREPVREVSGDRKVFQLSPKFRQHVFPGFSGDRRRLSQESAQLDDARHRENMSYVSQRRIYGFSLERVRGTPGAARVTPNVEVESLQDEFCSFVPDSMTVVGPAKCYFEVTLVGTGHLDTANLFVGVAFRGFRTGSHRPDIGDPSGALFDRAAFLVSGFEHMAAFGQTLRCAQGDVTPNNGVKDCMQKRSQSGVVIEAHPSHKRNKSSPNFKSGYDDTRNAERFGESNRRGTSSMPQNRLGPIATTVPWNRLDVIGVALNPAAMTMRVSVNGDNWQRFSMADVDPRDDSSRCTPLVCVAGNVFVRVNLGQSPFKYAAPSLGYSSFLNCAEEQPILMEANDLVAARLRQWEQEDASRSIEKLKRVTAPKVGGAEKVNGE